MSLVGKAPRDLVITIRPDTSRFAAALVTAGLAAREAAAVQEALVRLRHAAAIYHADLATAEERARTLAETTALGAASALDHVVQELIYRWLRRTQWSRPRRHRARLVTRRKQRRRW